ncbi:MAG: RNA-guided endonuclease TnpB family protein [Nitrososphaera sp.]
MVAKQLAAARKSAIGRLKYRHSNDYNSFTYNQTGFRLDSKLMLSKIGNIKIVMHRKPVNVKQVTICSKNGKWYAVAACQILRKQYSTIRYKKPVGIDVGITKFCHDSDNHIVGNPQFLTRMLRPVKRTNRRLSRRQIGSNNYRKAKHMLAKLYERIHNKRKDFLHKLSNNYSKHYDLIFLEHLKVLNMTKNHRLARKILDASWSTFKLFLQYKANRIVEIPSPYTTIKCSRCSHNVPKSLAIRTHICSNCGLTMDRDYNASLNILQKGMALLPQELRQVTPVEIAEQSRKQEE